VQLHAPGEPALKRLKTEGPPAATSGTEPEGLAEFSRMLSVFTHFGSLQVRLVQMLFLPCPLPCHLSLALATQACLPVSCVDNVESYIHSVSVFRCTINNHLLLEVFGGSNAQG
jgi:hypothetical protein